MTSNGKDLSPLPWLNSNSAWWTLVCMCGDPHQRHRVHPKRQADSGVAACLSEINAHAITRASERKRRRTTDSVSRARALPEGRLGLSWQCGQTGSRPSIAAGGRVLHVDPHALPGQHRQPRRQTADPGRLRRQPPYTDDRGARSLRHRAGRALERMTRFELATSTLGRSRSTN